MERRRKLDPLPHAAQLSKQMGRTDVGDSWTHGQLHQELLELYLHQEAGHDEGVS